MCNLCIVCYDIYGLNIHNRGLFNIVVSGNGIKKYELQRVIIADHSINPELIESLYVFSKKNGFAIGIIPKVSNFSLDPEARFTANPIACAAALTSLELFEKEQTLKKGSQN